ncbi:MAG: hypothetical protein HRU14_04630 [Planctomycetes bacterium]|nr:hypothetical protein [Planctomycetota bacterium]
MSPRPVVLPRGLVRLRTREASELVGEPVLCATEPAASASAPRPAMTALDLKAIQRKAYERGYAHALEERGAAVESAVASLESAAESLRAARVRDDAEIAEFAVRLAHSIAEEVVGKTIERGQHDVPAMVRRVLDAVMPDLDGDVVQLHGHPADLELLPTTLRHGSTAVRRVADASVPRGALRVQGGDAEFYAGLTERLEAIRDRLMQEVNDGAA